MYRQLYKIIIEKLEGEILLSIGMCNKEFKGIVEEIEEKNYGIYGINLMP